MLEDQQKINQFARLHRKLEELEEDAKSKKNEIQTLDDASAEILMLTDDEEQVRTAQALTVIRSDRSRTRLG